MSARPIVVGLSVLVLVLLAITAYVVWPAGSERVAGEADAGVPAPVEVVEIPRPPPEPLRAAATGEMPHRPNLILITVDTVRADHLSTYGYYRDTSDGLTRLAENGAVFTRAYSTSSWTAPSVASILTGVLPSEHGVREAVFHPEGHVTVDPLVAESPSLPRALAEAGYRTVGVTANGHLLGEHGYSTGFETYRCLGFADVAELEPEVMSRSAELLADERPFFLWVHVLDPHAPYTPETGDRPRYWAGEPRPELDALHFPEGIALALRRMPTREDVDYLAASYDDELRRAFAFVERVVGAFDDEPFVAIVTSDHGEEFGEHLGMGHGNTLFQEAVHVPFVVIAPGFLTRTEVPTEISSVDVLPTFLDLAGAPALASARGMSLVPVLRGAALPARDVILESGRNHMTVLGMVRDGMKYGFRLRPTEIERLFDLVADPEEHQDLMSARTELARAMRARLETAVAESEARRPSTASADIRLGPEDIDRLRALGYLHEPAAPAPR